VDAAQIDNQGAVDEDKEIVVAEELQRDAGCLVVHEEVARLIREVAVMLDAGSI